MADNWQKVLRAVVDTLKGPRWEVNRVKEWDITIDISRAADRFVLDIANVEGNYTDLFGFGDKVTLRAEMLDGSQPETVLAGFIDDLTENYSIQGNTLRIDGRDSGVYILENDAIPTTHKTITLKDLAAGILGEFGIPFSYSGPTIKIDGKQIRIGQNGWDTIEAHALENDLRLYRIDGKVYIGKFQPMTDVQYTFVDNRLNEKEIAYMSLNRKKAGSSRKREIWAYGTGKAKPVVKLADNSLPAAFKRRQVVSGGKTRADTEKSAKERMARNKIGSNEIELVIKGTRVIHPGRWATIVRRWGPRGYTVKWVIASVRYTCSSSRGETTTVICRPIEEVLG
ncbi:phage baseplate assembly protein [Brevibacillus fluminis]|uniref:phage baseplate assembly protein n=1 Tax=Brevibacillus fluminis TaxID=511487 RepID=UPI003F8B1267